jgi:hypothetical protein
MIKANEARQITIDNKKDIKERANNALKAIEIKIDTQVREYAKKGDLQCLISTREMADLYRDNIEASKLCCLLLGNLLETHGYKTYQVFTNRDALVTIYWDK